MARLEKSADNKKKTIGEGTFGKVKLGIHIPTGEKVAIKILEKDKIQDKEDLDRITREVTFLKKLRHQNIINIFEIIENSKNYFIIMEYASGGELFNFIVKKKRLDESEASFFFNQIISGLDYIHKNLIVHRDLKPENLLLTENKLLKIIDFGLSNSYKQNGTLSTPCGSPCYAAPEMILGKKYNGLCVDTWSTGIILFAMVCGYLPFEDKNNDKLYKKILECKLDFPYHVSTACKDLIKKILTVNPAKRIKLEEIKSHPFLKEKEGLISFSPKPELDLNIVNKMIEMGYEKEEVVSNLESNKHNNLTTTYNLLLNKEKRENANFSVLNLKTNSDNPPSARSSSKNANNINININYMNKIGNINININEKEGELHNINNQSVLSDASVVRNSEKFNEKENSLINSKLNSERATSPDKICKKENLEKHNNKKETDNLNLDNSLVLGNNNYNEKSNALNYSAIHSTNGSTLAGYKVKTSPIKHIKKPRINNYHKSNTSFCTNTNEKREFNDSITLDLPSYMQNKKNESNNIILPNNYIPQVNRLIKFYPNKKTPQKNKDNYSSRLGYHINKKINTSVTFENSSGNRSPSKETGLKSFIPRNTINLMNNENNSGNQTKFRSYLENFQIKSNHKNSHSLTNDKNYFHKGPNMKSEVCTINLVDDSDTGRKTIRAEETLTTWKKNNLKTDLSKTCPTNKVSQNKNLSNAITDYKRRTKNMSISETRSEGNKYSYTFSTKANDTKNNKHNPTINIQEIASEITINTKRNIKLPNSTKNQNIVSFNASTQNKFQSFKNVKKNSKVIDLTSIFSPNRDIISYSKKAKSPASNYSFNGNMKKIAPYCYNTPVTSVNLVDNKLTNKLVNKITSTKPFAYDMKSSPKKSVPEVVEMRMSNLKDVDELTPNSLKHSRVLNSTQSNNSTHIIKFDLNENETLAIPEIKDKKSDFALMTISEDKVATILDNLKLYCCTNDLELKETEEETKFDCISGDSKVSIELKEIESMKMLKLQHLSGDEQSTKKIIKNIIVNIGF